MMITTETINLIVGLITALTAVIAIFLVIRQTRQLDETLRSQVYQGLIDNSLKINTLLFEYPEFRKYVYGNATVDENTPDLEKIMGVMDYVVDIVDNMKAQEKFIPKSEKLGWEKFAEDVLSSPAATFYLKKHGYWFSSGIPEIIKNQDKVSTAQKIKMLIRKLPNFLMFHKAPKSTVKSYVSPKTSIRRSSIHGLGMFASTDIRKGEIVFIKGGYILTKQELYASNKIESYLPISDGFFLGATRKSEEKKVKLFVNHSCDPNCGFRGEITFVAMRDIYEGEELTFDYAMIDNEDYSFECCCGTKTCRKEVTGFDWMNKELQEKYSLYFARYLLDKINLA